MSRRSFNDAFRRAVRENRGEPEPPPPSVPEQPVHPVQPVQPEELETPNEALRRLLRDSKKA